MGTIDELGTFRVVAYLIVYVMMIVVVIQHEMGIALAFVMFLIYLFGVKGAKAS